MDRETRVCPLSIEEREQKTPRLIGYAARFNVLSENLGGFRETIRPGAFDNVLTDDVRALINHDSTLILGRTGAGTLSLASDENGLHYTIEPPETRYAADLMQSIRRGDVSQSSFAFTIDQDSWKEDEDGRVIRTIESVRRLYDISPVTFAAYPDTDVAVRSLADHNREQGTQAQTALRNRYAQRAWLSLNHSIFH